MDVYDVRTVALVGISGRKQFFFSVLTGKAYASEVKLGRKFLAKTNL